MSGLHGHKKGCFIQLGHMRDVRGYNSFNKPHLRKLMETKSKGTGIGTYTKANKMSIVICHKLLDLFSLDKQH